MKKRTASALFFVMISALSMISGIFIQRQGVPAQILYSIKKSVFTETPDSQDYTKPVANTYLEIFGIPTEVFDPLDSYIYKTGEESGPLDSSYRYYWHYEEIADYLVSDEAKSDAIEAKNEFWVLEEENSDVSFDKIEKKRTFLKKTLGVKDLAPHCRVQSSEFVHQGNHIEIKRLLLESRIHSISVPVYSVLPDKPVKGVVIAVHGHSGAPEKVIGLEERDYTRAFGKKLAEAGYAVFAPYVLNISRLNTNIHALGMLYSGNTKYSIDIQKLLSVVDYIKADPALSELPVILYGISYGGRLSFMLAAIDERIDILVSSGGMKLNLEFLDAHFSLENRVYWDSEVIFNRPYHVHFRFFDLAEMFFPKPLILEIGSYDLGDHPDAIVHEWENMKKIYSRNGNTENLKLAWFRGYHETAPQLTIPMIDALVENMNR